MVLTDFLKVFAFAVSFGVAFLTITSAFLLDATYLLSPSNWIEAVYVFGTNPDISTDACPLEFVII